LAADTYRHNRLFSLRSVKILELSQTNPISAFPGVVGSVPRLTTPCFITGWCGRAAISEVLALNPVAAQRAALTAQLADLGGTVLPGSPADFGKFIGDETEKP
jgi:hypothetical protein